MAIKVINIDTTTLGDRSYLVHDGKTAVIIDPQRDTDRFNDLLALENVKLEAVVETHIHNDYVSGGLELSRQHGAKYLINKDDEVAFEFQGVVNQQVLSFGTFAIRALHTPGHTYTHMSYELLDSISSSIGVFTGGSLLHGATGRPDLLGRNHANELAGLQYQSAHLLLDSIQDNAELYPTHGFGSFCSATPTLADSSTIADEKKTNPVLLNDLKTYVDLTMDALDVYPAYFKKMGHANSNPSTKVNLSEIPRMSPHKILNEMKSGAWLVDLRNRKLWAKEHILGSVSLGIDGSLASYLGWLYPYEKKLYLFSDSSRDVLKAQRELVRIGIDCPNGSFVGPPDSFESTSSVRESTFAEFAATALGSQRVLLDVRQVHERRESYIDSSIFIPFYEVQARVTELPEGIEIWVHCASGYRASSIIGFIESSGRTPVLINDDYETAASIKGLNIISNVFSVKDFS
jgi:hydroxyacylglutathione hydrolase